MLIFNVIVVKSASWPFAIAEQQLKQQSGCSTQPKMMVGNCIQAIDSYPWSIKSIRCKKLFVPSQGDISRCHFLICSGDKALPPHSGVERKKIEKSYWKGTFQGFVASIHHVELDFAWIKGLWFWCIHGNPFRKPCWINVGRDGSTADQHRAAPECSLTFCNISDIEAS